LDFFSIKKKNPRRWQEAKERKVSEICDQSSVINVASLLQKAESFWIIYGGAYPERCQGIYILAGPNPSDHTF
jgi:hypothetical protein